VCGGVLLLPRREKTPGRFNLPYINGKIIYPVIVIGAMILIAFFSKDYYRNLFDFDFSKNQDYVDNKVTFMDLATFNISQIIFWIVCLVVSVITFFKNYSLIPLMGLTCCLYLLTGMTKSNWAWFFSWLAIGLVIYLLYGYRKSKLALP
ncbi:MAG TPA: amino acid permease C-terminal domain-containing protein, partial [Chitinophagaceae bacterium]|nr:amino acid permease C-terminal domain-containing protein [Chitinophagaceae bacterium]